MQSWLKTYLGLSSKSKQSKNFDTLDQYLKQLMRPKQFHQLCSSLSDRRNVWMRVEEIFGSRQDLLLTDLARLLHLAYLPRVLPMEIASLPNGLSAAELRRQGFVGVAMAHHHHKERTLFFLPTHP